MQIILEEYMLADMEFQNLYEFISSLVLILYLCNVEQPKTTNIKESHKLINSSQTSNLLLWYQAFQDFYQSK